MCIRDSFCGARSVFITDVNQYRLDLAKKMGATEAVNLKTDSIEELMKKHHIVEGFDVGMEMSGSGAALNQLLGLMRNGGKVALLGIAGPVSYTHLDVYKRQLRNCDLNSIPVATNVATAEVLIQGLARGDLAWREIINPVAR